MKEFFFVFVMSHYHGRYKSEEISPFHSLIQKYKAKRNLEDEIRNIIVIIVLQLLQL